MTDPTETLAMASGDPDAGYAGMGLMTPELLQMQRQQMAQRGMLTAIAANNPNAAIGMALGGGISRALGSPGTDQQMQNAQRNSQLLNLAASARQKAAAGGGDDLDQQEAFYGTLAQAGVPAAFNQLAAIRKARVDQAHVQAQTMQEGTAAAKNNLELGSVGHELGEVGVDGKPDYRQRAVVNKADGSILKLVGEPYKVGGSSTTVNVGDKEAQPFYENAAKGFDPIYSASKNNLDAIAAVDRARGYLDAGAITGSTAGARQSFANFATSIGLAPDTTVKELANSKAFQSAVFDLARTSAKGMTSRITQWELQFISKVNAGDMNDAEAALRSMLAEVRKQHEQSISTINQRRDELSKLPKIGDQLGQLYPTIPVPQQGTPAAAAPAAGGVIDFNQMAK